ncbi:hypothetical protein QWZ13_00470 [Reinekea marina]|uniref:hypothetical protein n=1 Tax=Reinekea marina TaxID=1310421 RepID=UPI0025B3C63B|nr:hypothetical protein [Reinekea marina]MDN3647376.1 hypothetical protein [Reinekea marina]
MTQMPIPAKPTTKANHQRQDKVRALEAKRRRDCSNVVNLLAACSLKLAAKPPAA